MFWLEVLGLFSLTFLIAGHALVRVLYLQLARIPRAEEPARSALLPTTLAKATTRALEGVEPGHSLVAGLADGAEALRARLDLVNSAEVSLDVQYYIWQPDSVGSAVLHALRAAAVRGIQLRVLVDDLGSIDAKPALADLARQPNVEFRVFNPFVLKRYRLLNLLLDFGRLNRRMHNKSITADGVASIVGGRNLGDEYFVGANGKRFMDFDVLVAGPAAEAVSQDFAHYWNCASSLPVPVLPISIPLLDPVRLPGSVTSPVANLLSGTVPLTAAPVRLLSDDPRKVEGRILRRRHMAAQLSALLAQPKADALLVTAYLIPGRRGLAQLQALAHRGVRVRILTNSHRSNDVFAVHSRYTRYRKDLLRSGIELFELQYPGRPRHRRRRLRLGARTDATSLHSKTFIMDDDQFFVGSFNLDQRSAFLNTEMGLLVHSPHLGRQVAQDVLAEMKNSAWQVILTPKGRLQWQARSETHQVLVRDCEPDTPWSARLLSSLVGRLPIDWLL